MSRVIIASDSTCDLSPELVARYGIQILPLGVTLGEKQFTDGVDITPEDVYAHYTATGELPKTSAVNIAAFDDYFREHTADGSAIVLFTISSFMSSTCNNARIAAEEYDNVYVIDSQNLSTGIGLMVIAAAEMAREGKSAKEIADACTLLTSRIDSSFVVDDLEFLHKGGRCSAVAALGANLLHLKPCITVKDGKMGMEKKYRGKFPAVLEKYIAERIGDGSGIDLTRVFVTHAGCDEALIARCAALVKSAADFKEVHVTLTGCTVASHCGRNTLGILFLRKE